MHNNNATPEKLIFEEQARLGLIQIEQSGQGNFLTTQSYNQLVQKMYDWVEDPEIYAVIFESNSTDCFSLGSNPTEMLLALEHDKNAALAHIQQQYESLWRIECYTKPFILIVNGRVEATTAALSQFGTHLIAGENFSFAVPEVRSGFFPSAGICHILADLPHAIGTYLALTGRAIDRADAFYLGLVEHIIDAAHYGDIKRKIADADPIDPILDGLHRDPPSAELEKVAEPISRAFSQESVEQIIETLESETGEHAVWAHETAGELKNLPPLSLKVTLKALQQAKGLTADQNLEADFQLACHFFGASDYVSALRAAQSNQPMPDWNPSNLEDVTKEAVEKYFTPCSQSPLTLPSRELGVDK